MDVTSLYTNIPQREGITTVCNAYEEFHLGNPPVPTGFSREMLSLILQENSFQFNGKDYLQTHGTAMGTFTAEISEIETTFLDTKVYKGVRFNKDSILDVRTHFKSTETFQYTNFYSCHPPGVTKGFIKGEALRLLRTNSSEITFEENIKNFSTRLKNRDYPNTTVEKHISEVNFSDRKKALEQRNKNARKKILPFVTQYHPALPNLKKILMGKWHLIQNQPYLRNIFKEPPLISYRKGKSLKDTLVRAKL